MALFEIFTQTRIVGTLTTFDRMIFKGHPRGRPARRDLGDAVAAGVPAHRVHQLRHGSDRRADRQRQSSGGRGGSAVHVFGPFPTSRRDLTEEDTARRIADVTGSPTAWRACSAWPSRAGRSRCEPIPHPPLGGDPSRTQLCDHYVYLIDPEFGPMHVRVQAWIPTRSRSTSTDGVAGPPARRRRGRLPPLRHRPVVGRVPEDRRRAVRELAHLSWPRLLDAFADASTAAAKITAAGFGGYSWVLDQAEIATDVMFQTRPQLLAIWPDPVPHASVNLSSTDVLRFLVRELHPH